MCGIGTVTRACEVKNKKRRAYKTRYKMFLEFFLSTIFMKCPYENINPSLNIVVLGSQIQNQSLISVYAFQLTIYCNHQKLSS